MKRKKPGMRELIANAAPKLPRHEVEEIGRRVWLKLNAEMEMRKDELALRSLSGDGWNHAPALEEGDFQILSAVLFFAFAPFFVRPERIPPPVPASKG